MADFELCASLRGAQDGSGAYLSIRAGGEDANACDWAGMLLRMYTRWAERQALPDTVIAGLRHPQAGVYRATIHIAGDFAFGRLQGEVGVHQLVRVSPFSAPARRRTTRTIVDVLPDLEGEAESALSPDEISYTVFRTGGPGGQHL